MQSLYDITIVGGGLVGASLAQALHTTSLRLAIIEMNLWCQTRNDERIIALNLGSQRILQGIGVWSAVAPQTSPIKQIHVSDHGQFGFTRLEPTVLNAPALGYVVSAAPLNQTLQTVLTHSPVEILAPARLTQVEIHDDEVEVDVLQAQQHFKLRTRLLVIADGGHSELRHQLGIVAHERDYQQIAVIAKVEVTRPHENCAYERFTATGPLALLPLRTHECSLVWTMALAEAPVVAALNDRDFLQTLQRQFGWRLGRFVGVSSRQVYPLRLIRVPLPSSPRLVAIGNAAHTLHPVAGQGFNLGLRDVASLAEAIVTAAQRGHDVGSRETLECYYAWQTPDQQRLMTLTDTLVRVFSNTQPSLTFARNLGLLLTDAITPFKKQLVQQMSGLNGHPSRLLRGLPL